MAWVVWPPDQLNELPALAVRVTLPPVQNVVAPLAEMVAFGFELTVTVVAEEVAFPQALPVVTV